jgi:4-amino-4-deoxy-L-arabinose transferase-like glycosyltransferase
LFLKGAGEILNNIPNLITRNKIIFGGLIILLLILAFSFQGQRGLWQPDEGYYVGTAATMLTKQSFLIPYLGEDEIFLDKPPLLYWGMIPSMKILGQNEFAVRFFHGVCYAATCLIVGLLAMQMFGSRRMMVLSSVVYGTMLLPFIAANYVTPDTPLALCAALSAFALWKSITADKPHSAVWKLVLFSAVGVGFLAKGPAVFIPIAGLVGFLAIGGRLKAFILDMWFFVGIAMFLSIGLGWYIWVGCTLPGSFSYFFDNQVWGRLISEKYQRNPGIKMGIIYLPVLLLGTLPWCVLWLQRSARNKLAQYRNKACWLNLVHEPKKLFLVAWFIIPLSILCLASSKLSLYALPLFAPLAIASAKLWSDRIDAFIVKAGIRSVVLGSIRFVLIWSAVLVLGRYAAAIYPTDHDSRALWQEISRYVPDQDYEINTIDQRADGLIFYGAKKVEHITLKQYPYPTYLKTEHLLEEISGNIKEGEQAIQLLLAYKTEITEKTCPLLSDAGIEFNRIKLSGQRWLIVLRPPGHQKTLSGQTSN